MNRISIKFTVVSLFLFLSSIIVIAMIYIQYSFSQELIQRSVNDQMKLLSTKVEDNIKYITQNNANTVTNVSNLLKDKTLEVFLEDKQKFFTLFTDILKNNQNLYAVYVGFENDGFFELINLDIDPVLRAKYGATQQDRWLYVEIIDEKQKLILLDNNLNETARKVLENSYFSTSRPWYKNALRSNKVIKTNPYSFSNIDGKGMTFAKKIQKSNNVFAVDLLINNMNNILKEYSGSILENSYLLDKDRSIIASSSGDKQSSMIPKTIELFQDKKIDNSILNEMTIDDKKYIYSIIPLNDSYLYSYSDSEKIIEPFQDKIQNMLFMMVFILLAVIPIILYFSSIIVKPILLLVQESKKVKNREFQKVHQITTKVSEIHTLSASLKDMSESISQYQTNLEKKVEERTLELKEKNLELKKLSVTDKLTGLYNRIKLDESLIIAKERVDRYDEIFGVIIIDIDFFKSVNDTHGHQAGDVVLVEFASILKNSVRRTDILGRWGGEEFMIVCTQTNLENIMILAEKLRKDIESFNFSIVKHKTASFGVATYQKGEALETMIDRADQALYIAKEKGRNKAVTLQKKH